ncbi:HyaD/HybD family hydrogenase maturation endopeptidase [Yersinia aleksiciae]|uniref:Hydrogenase 2 maturation endopeptidase n=1 Tax=Yersinia aleksiciae TaxID=263819 RepID=A0A0T9U6K5_YERAE|nr:HyaD/HybD family hydrogenase maturation endopeptidase [Yersinia aleksiciae]AKP33083.1 hydrogenase 2 maturation endopeptidase [Yersinia aleksiciae]MDN0122274.1 HyaD/HybD family hydrogenase maturation endopeptidase [Yersinia aleksiciae]CFQ48620.1 hydrogenase 2 maturation endopeptidase [Yersinia aleksiciae]CNL22536.1 hydrogenase 2 maturation endopeptidase [Yersinia aleksiciae]
MGILVLGIGNLLLSDEAVGVRLVEALEQRFDIPAGVEVLDGGTAGLELMEAMANREHLIVADAVLTGQSPGSVAVLRDKEIPAMFSRKVSPHQLGLCDVLMALQLTDEFPRQLTLVGVVPESLAPGIGLTATVTQAMEPALEQILAALRASGITLKPREESHV